MKSAITRYLIVMHSRLNVTISACYRHSTNSFTVINYRRFQYRKLYFVAALGFAGNSLSVQFEKPNKCAFKGKSRYKNLYSRKS